MGGGRCAEREKGNIASVDSTEIDEITASVDSTEIDESTAPVSNVERWPGTQKRLHHARCARTRTVWPRENARPSSTNELVVEARECAPI